MTAFDQAWSLMKALLSEEVEWDSLSKQDRLDIAELFAGLGGSDFMGQGQGTTPEGVVFDRLGIDGWGGAAKERGHNVQMWELEPTLNLNPGGNYHTRDVLSMTADDVVDAFDGRVPDAMVASVPCTKYSMLGGGIGWKTNDAVLQLLDQFKPKRFEQIDAMTSAEIEAKRLKEEQRMDAYIQGGKKGTAPRWATRNLDDMELKTQLAWQSLKPIWERMREAGDPILGVDVHVPKTVDEMMYYQTGAREGLPKFKRGKPVKQSEAEETRSEVLNNKALLSHTTGMIDDLVAMGMPHFLIENPRAKMRFQSEVQPYPRLEIDMASYREPANRALFGLPKNPDFQQLEGLPGLKPTDLFGVMPDTFVPRPKLEPSKKNPIVGARNVLYAEAPAGSKEGVQAMKPVPAGQIYPGSPKITDKHVRSVIPYSLGLDFITALERHYGMPTHRYDVPGLQHSVNPGTQAQILNAAIAASRMEGIKDRIPDRYQKKR